MVVDDTRKERRYFEVIGRGRIKMGQDGDIKAVMPCVPRKLPAVGWP